MLNAARRFPARPLSARKVPVKNPCDALDSWSADIAVEQDAVLVNLAEQLDAEREAQGLMVTELARKGRVECTPTYRRRVPGGSAPPNAPGAGACVESAIGSVIVPETGRPASGNAGANVVPDVSEVRILHRVLVVVVHGSKGVLLHTSGIGVVFPCKPLIHDAALLLGAERSP